MQLIWLLSLVSSLAAAPSGLKYRGCTSQQCAVEFVVPSASACTLIIYTDSARTVKHPDTDTSLHASSSACNRSTSEVQSTRVQFTLGTRTQDRSLAAETTYYFRITDTGDSGALDGVVSTSTIGAGNIYPNQGGYDSATWDLRDHPAFSYSSRNQILVDPVTGLKKTLATAPGDAFAQKFVSGDAFSPQLDEAQSVSGSWTNLTNINTNGTSYASVSGAASVWVPIPSDLPSSGYSATSSATAWNQFNPNRMNLDYFFVRVCGSADGTALGAGNNSEKVTVSFGQTTSASAYHGGSASVTFTGTNACQTIPQSSPDPGFASWAFATPPVKTDLVPAIIQVSVSGSTVTREGGDYFQPQTWPTGIQIVIPGSSSWSTPCSGDVCTISSYTSASVVTVSGSCSSGCPSSGSPVNAVPKHIGIKVVRQGSSGSINLSLGYEIGMSPVSQIGEDATSNHCSTVPVSGGYNCWFSQVLATAEGTFYRYDPAWLYNPAVPAMTPISITRYYANWSSNGLSTTGTIQPQFAGWDATDGNVFYGTLSYSGTVYLIKGDLSSCGPSYAAWAGYRTYTAGGYSPGTGGCVTYTNLSATSIGSQVATAYATYNPGFDISAFAIAQADTTFANGYFRVMYVTNGGDTRLAIYALFNTSGTLVQIWDSWSHYPMRFGYSHGPTYGRLGSTSWTTLTRFVSAGSASRNFGGPFEALVTAVNRSSTPGASWDSNTALTNTEVYTCPGGLPGDVVALGASGNHCVQIRLEGQPCSHTPGSATIYPGSQNEAQKFPCPYNAAYSKLQNLAVKDVIQDKGNFYSESFIIAAITSTSPLEMWVIRGDGVWPSSGQANNQFPDYRLMEAHSNGWTAAVSPPFWAICTAAFMYIDGTAGLGNPNYCASHGVIGPAFFSTKTNYVGLDINSSNNFATLFDASTPTFPPISLSTPHNPMFGGLTTALATNIQLYTGTDQEGASQSRRMFSVHQRHLNGLVGGSDPSGNSLWAETLALESGTSNTYKVTDSASTYNAKLVPLQGFAGRFRLRDISSATTGNQITDATPYTSCYALRANECRTGSSAGDRFVSVPYTETNGGSVLAGQHLRNVPALSAPSIGGQIQQVCIDRMDPEGRCQRFLGLSLTGPGGQYAFQGPRVTPDGLGFFETQTLGSGYQTQIVLSQLPSLIPDSKNRTRFVPVPISIGPISGMTHARVRFGYDGTFYCTDRTEECITDGSLTPYAFAGDSLTNVSCSSGCTISVPAIPGRVLRYRVERFDGATWTNYPVEMHAVN